MKLIFASLLVATSVFGQAYSLAPGGGSTDLTAPGPIGGTTPGAGAFTTLSATGVLSLAAANGLQFGSTSKIIDSSGELRLFAGTLTHSVIALTDATRLAVQAPMVIGWTGSTTSASATLDVALGRSGGGAAEVNTGTLISGTSNAATIRALAFIPAGTAPTCTGGVIGTGSKSNAGFVTSNAAGSIVITFPVTAPTGWNVEATNMTSAARPMPMTAHTTTTATLTGTPTNNDVITYIAMPY